MRGFRFSRRCLGAVGFSAMLAASSPALGVQVFTLSGGWNAVVDDGSQVSIVDDGVFNDAQIGTFLAIEVSKDFVEPPDGQGIYPAQLITFIQTNPDATTVPRIVIIDEAVSNQTGTDWTDYHYAMLDGGQAWFNVPLSDFDPSPFTNVTFSDNQGLGDPNKASDIDIDGGVVPAGTTFFPAGNGGEIVIDASLAGGAPVTFTFKQFPTPEPGSLLLLVSGGLLVAMRRRG
jgi:hypothetical protein